MNRLRRHMHSIRYWLRRRHWPIRRVLRITGIILLISVALQLLWPRGRALPGVSVGSISVGGQTVSMAKNTLDKAYASANITVVAGAYKTTTSFDKAGISPQIQQTAQQVTDYPLIWRLVPFSSAFIGVNRATALTADFDNERLKYLAQQISKDSYIAAKDASVAVKNGKIKLVSAQSSQTYATNDITKGIKNNALAPDATVTIKAQLTDASRTDDKVETALERAQKAIDTPLSFSVNSQTITVSKNTIGTWLDFKENKKTETLSLVVSTKALKKYLTQTVQPKVYKAPGSTIVTVVDDVETGRATGVRGQGINADKIISLVKSALQSGEKTTVSVPVITLEPTVVYKHSYTKTNAGLAALLKHIANDKGIAVTTLYGPGLSANINGTKQFEAGSTYKLFVAYVVFQKMNSGEMHWSDQIYEGRNATTCFDDMIVKSDNNCAEAFAAKVGGWQVIENTMHELGLTDTNLTGSFAITTASDLSLYLQKLQTGSLLSDADANRLIGAMKRQIYRSGIPEGTGLAVADKVGFVDDVTHDAGIVYSPQGPYVLVVMTSNSSWDAIASIASQVNEYLK